MDGRKYQRKSGIKRTLVMLLALVMLASVCFPAMWVSAEEVDGEPVSVEDTFKNKLAGLAAQVDSFAGIQDEYNALVGSVDALRAEIAGAEGLDEAVAAELNAQLDTLSGTLLAKKPQELSDPDVPVEDTFKDKLSDLAAQVDCFAGTQDEYDALAGSVDALRVEIAGAEGLDEAVAAELNAQLDTLSGTLLAKKPQELSDPDVPVEDTFKNKLAGLAAQVDSFAGTQDEYDALVGSVDALRTEIAGAEGLDEAVAAELNAQLDTLSGTLLAKKPQELSDPDVPEEPVMSEAAKAYLIQIEECKGQLEALDPSAPDYEDQLETVIEALAAVVENAQMDTSLTEEEYAAILSAADAVLAGPGEAPEQPSDFGDTPKLVNSSGKKSLTIHFVDDKDNPLSSTTSQNYSVGDDWVSFAEIGDYYPVEGYTYNRAYYKDFFGQKIELTNIRYGNILHNWYINGGYTSLNRDIFLEYKKGSTPVRVYVYVAGEKWKNNPEFQELIQLYACDENGYFPAGEIELSASYFAGKENQNALINNDSDWAALLAALDKMDPSKLTGTEGVAWSGNGTRNFDQNKENKVSGYSSQALKVFDEIAGSGSTALFRWDGTTSYGFKDQSVQYHLDLAFNTNTITFFTGKNGITSEAAGDAKDGTLVDYRTYITGSEILRPETLNVPTGYKVEGYYTDADLTTPWNGIGTHLNEDQTVYIKITLNNDIGTGAGELHITGEKVWVGDEGTGLRPDSIEVKLQGSTSADGPWTTVGTKTVVPDADGKWLYDFNVSDRPYTHYQVIEEVPKSYTVEYVQPQVTFTYPSASDWSGTKPCNTITFKENTNKSTIIGVKKGNDYLVWTYYALTPGEQQLVKDSIIKYDKGNQQSKFTFFSGLGATTDGITVTENQLDFVNPNGWSYYFSGAYTKASTSATHSTITNTLSTATVTITKQVKGNMGDPNKSFPFTVTLTDGTMTDGEYSATGASVAYTVRENGTKISFSLSDDQSVILQNVPLGAKLFITEKDTGAYTVKIGDTALTKDDDGNASDSIGISVTAEMGEIIVVNENEATIDTGIVTDSLPYILLLTMAVIGAGVLLNKRRVF